MLLNRRTCLALAGGSLLASGLPAGLAAPAPASSFRLLYPSLGSAIPRLLRDNGVEIALYLPRFAFFAGSGTTPHLQADHIIDQCRNFALPKLGEQGSRHVVINIEADGWRWFDRNPDAESRALARERMAEVIGLMRSELPGFELSVYNLPGAPLYAATKRRERMPEDWRWRVSVMEEAGPLLDKLACTAPSQYCFSDREWEEWKEWTRLSIGICKTLYPDLPCYPWIWAIFHPAGESALEPLPAGRFREVLDTVYEAGADGAFLWRGADAEKLDGWMEETVEFVRQLPA